jgi:lipoprotein NlpD
VRRLSLAIAILLTASCSHEPVRTGTYTVRSGDTVYAIAKRYRMDYRDLARWNHLGRDYAIEVGQVLMLHAPIGTHTRPGAATRSAAALPAPPSSKNSSPKNSEETGLSTSPMPKWVWPVDGGATTAIERPNGAQGLGISGSLGQEIHAASEGRVVYTGTGLLGYGQLIIVKHNDAYLTAYGYTQSVLVKEGEQVRTGQAIATMGAAPQGTPLLYFEIRLNGKPVEPLPLLPKR